MTARKENIYVATSWRNPYQASTVQILRGMGHDVYDFKNPCEGDTGFAWKEIDPAFEQGTRVTAAIYSEMMRHPAAIRGYNHDVTALFRCTVCIAVVPFGKSASWELGYAKGAAKRCYLLQFDNEYAEPELMFQGCKILTEFAALFDEFGFPS